jgi:hypothetical protein
MPSLVVPLPSGGTNTTTIGAASKTTANPWPRTKHNHFDMPRISEAVKQDHALIKRAFRRLREADPDTRRPEEFVWALDRYLIVEDLVVSPALDSHIAHGGERHRRLSEDFDSVSTGLCNLLIIDHDEVED